MMAIIADIVLFRERRKYRNIYIFVESRCIIAKEMQ